MTKEEKMVDENRRLIDAEAFKYASNVPITTVKIEAYKIANDAAKNFDPKEGAKFSTYLTNSLQKLSRLNTQYGAIVRVPENKQFKINKLNNIEKHLEAQYGRPPSIEELADHSGFNIQTVSELMQNRKSTVNIDNLAFTPIFVDNSNDDWVHFVYHDLPPRDKIIMEHKIGFGGKPLLDNEVLAEKLNISQSTLSNRIKFISDKLAEGWH
jgi:DNA-directed RNA polymerase specialized sigma subunit